MFETTRGNAGVVDVYDEAAPYPVATSFAVEVYRILPNDTDFSPFRDSGRFTGLNSAYIDGSPVYHSPQDTPDYFNIDTLQHHGANALALAEAFGDADIAELERPAAGDATYFPVFGDAGHLPGLVGVADRDPRPARRRRAGGPLPHPRAVQLAAGSSPGSASGSSR